MSHGLAFVEYANDLPRVPQGYRVVCLTPEVQETLSGVDRESVVPEDYCSERDLEECGVANFRRVENFCAAVDRAIQDALPLARNLRVCAASDHYFRLKTLFDAFYLRSYEVSRVLESEGPDEVLFFCGEAPDVEREWYSNRESLYGIVVGALADRFGIRGKQLPHDIPRDGPTNDATRSHGRLTWRAALGNRSRKVASSCLRLTRRASDGECFLFLDHAYNLPYIGLELIKKRAQVWVWEEEGVPTRVGLWGERIGCEACSDRPNPTELEGLCHYVLHQPEIRAPWGSDEMDLWPLVCDRLTRLVTVCLPTAIDFVTEANQVFDRLIPKAIVASTLAHPRGRAIARAARSRGIPVVVSHHGALGTAYAPIHFYQDIDLCDGILCYGKAVADYPARHGRPHIATAVVGSPRIEALKKEAPSRRVIRGSLGLDPSASVVLYAPTGMQGNDRYLSYRVPSDRTCFRTHCRIIATLAADNRYRIVVKHHGSGPDNASLARWIARQDWPHVKSICSPPFSVLINMANAVVIDLASTVLLEALQTDCRVYLHNNWLKWEPGVLDAMRKVTVFSSDLDAFCERLGKDLASGEAVVPRGTGDSSFLDLCCKPNGRGSGAKLAAEYLLRPVEDGRLNWMDAMDSTAG